MRSAHRVQASIVARERRSGGCAFGTNLRPQSGMQSPRRSKSQPILPQGAHRCDRSGVGCGGYRVLRPRRPQLSPIIPCKQSPPGPLARAQGLHRGTDRPPWIPRRRSPSNRHPRSRASAGELGCVRLVLPRQGGGPSRPPRRSEQLGTTLQACSRSFAASVMKAPPSSGATSTPHGSGTAASPSRTCGQIPSGDSPVMSGPRQA